MAPLHKLLYIFILWRQERSSKSVRQIFLHATNVSDALALSTVNVWERLFERETTKMLG